MADVALLASVRRNLPQLRPPMDLSIIIVNWHSREYLRNCLASIVGSVRRVTYEIVVIDAGSCDGCDAMLREYYPSVRFVQYSNVGFAKANNRAFEESSGQVLLFLNPDTVVEQSAIDLMYEALLSTPNSGVMGCRLLNPDGSVQSSCIQAFPTVINQALDSECLRRRWPRSSLWGMAPLFEDGEALHKVEGISGACLMVQRALFEQVGRFSEDYFMYAEDMDLAFKVAQSGRSNYFVSGATVLHYGGQSSQQVANEFSAVMIREATRLFLRKTRGATYSGFYRISVLLSAAARLGILGAIYVVGRRRPSDEVAVRKWFAVLQWSLRRDDIVPKYYQTGA